MSRKLPTIKDRVRYADKAIKSHQYSTLSDDESCIRDLLTDLRHWCDAHERDFHLELDWSYKHYLEEKHGAK